MDKIKLTRQKAIAVLSLISILLSPITILADEVTFDQNFNPHSLIDDKVFVDTQTFGGAPGIQKFLESKNSLLAQTDPAFLARLKEPDITILKQGLNDPQPSLPRKRTAAELIWDASQSTGINPQVILVTMNKEQGLITSAGYSGDGLQYALDFALGFACPDSSGCGNGIYRGFYFQLFGNLDAAGNRYLGAPASLMKSFNAPNGRGPTVNGAPAQVGQQILITNTQGGPANPPAEQLVTLLNRATAALYRFTPHVYNGNYNFVKFFTSWFKYPNGTLVALTGDPNTYVIQNGARLLVPQFVAQLRNLDLMKTVTVSPNEVADYPQSKVYGPADNTVVKVTGEDRPYVFIENIKHPASPFVIRQRGLPVDTAIAISAAEANLFEQGAQLVPTDGTVIKAQDSNSYYLSQNGVLQLFSSFTLKQRKAEKSAVVVADTELQSYPKQGFVVPLDGSLVKSAASQTVYLIEQGLKHPLTGTIFKNRGLRFADIGIIGQDEAASLPIAAFATPKEKTFFKVAEDNMLYYFKDGTKHPISKFVAKQQGITADYTFSLAEAYEWFDGIPVSPRDKTLLKGDKDGTVYVVENKQLHALSASAFKARRYKYSQIKTLSQDEVDGYAKGESLMK